MDFSDLVRKYIAARDRKAEMKKAYDESVAKIDAVLDRVEAELLRYFSDNGLDSIKTDAGTAYRTTRTSATVADWDACFNFIREHELWHMLEHRVSKKAVEEFKAANDELPVGINWREEAVVNIRRG